jgi:3-oxoisoapionate decarboxylase
MKLGLSTYSFPWSIGASDFPTQKSSLWRSLLEFASQEKINHVQFGDNYPLDELSPGELNEISKTALENKIILEVGTSGLKVSNIHNYLSIAKQLNSSFLRVVIDDNHFYPGKEEVIKTINILLPILQEYNVCLAIENHDRFKAKDLEHIIQKTSAQCVGICLDTCNSLGAGEGIHEILPVLLPYTVNLHIKDFKIERVSHKMGFNIHGAVAGEGMLDIPWLLKECSTYEKCQTATLELWMDEEKDLNTTIVKEKQWIEKSINYLKKYTQ